MRDSDVETSAVVFKDQLHCKHVHAKHVDPAMEPHFFFWTDGARPGWEQLGPKPTKLQSPDRALQPFKQHQNEYDGNRAGRQAATRFCYQEFNSQV